MSTTLRIATRKSPLALWQANFVKDALIAHHPDVNVELLTLLTTADKLFATPLNKIGGKALFVKELEKAILDHQADVAVHSIKDLPAELPDQLTLGIVCKREDARDALVSSHYNSLSSLPPEAKVGTSSLRRSAQILAIRPDLNIIPLRGNVGTRIEKLESGEFDAIILAVAGLKRLNLTDKIKHYFTNEQILPAAGQGAVGIEIRESDLQHLSLLSFLEDYQTRQEILAERAVVQQLGGSCQFPIAAHATTSKAGQLTLDALVASTNGDKILRVQKTASHAFAEEIGLSVAEELICQGALELLAQVLKNNSADD